MLKRFGVLITIEHLYEMKQYGASNLRTLKHYYFIM